MLNAPRWPRRAVVSLLMLALLGASAAVAADAPAGADTVRDAQMWVLDAVSAPSAWSTTRGQGATVAVIDSGVNPDVSDLAGSVITGPDLTGVHTARANPNWGVHGTWMASLIAGHGHDGGGSGIVGVAPAAKVLSIRALTDRHDPGHSAYEHESDGRQQNALAKAITYAIRHHADVISMSLGYGQPSTVVRSALQDALDHGVVLVAASGNSGNSAGVGHSGQAPYSFPADYPGVLGVAAVSRSGSAAGFSSDNLSVQVAAPGVNVPAQGRDGQYWLVNGTSPACALTAGVAALIKARYPSLPPALVVQAITSSTQNRPSGGYDNKIGFGTVDAAVALTVAGKLAVQSRSQVGAATTLHFGGGAVAVPGVPIAPRGAAGLVVACLFTAAFLVATALAGMRLVTLRRSLSGGHHTADRTPQPVWSGPRVHATWPDRPDTGLSAEQAVGSADQGPTWPSWPDPSS